MVLPSKSNKQNMKYRSKPMEDCTKLTDINNSSDQLCIISTCCRVCLQGGVIEIYRCKNSNEIIQALQLFADIQVDEYDVKPKLLCNDCYKFLENAIVFRKMAKRSFKILDAQLKEEHLDENIEFMDPTLEEKDASDGGVSDTLCDKWDIGNKIETTKAVNKEKVKYSTKVTCHICNKVINRSYYKEHVTMHDPDHKKYVCDICGKSFRLRCAYHNHSLRHRSDFAYKCSFCPYRGRYAELLKTHMITHSGDYRYMCTECPARFLFKSNLNSHMLKHKEPQFKCDTCKRAFHTNIVLQRHYEAVHLGIKNHVCNICGKAFGYRNAMMKHQRHVHKREKLLFGRMPSYMQAENKKVANV